MKCLGPISTHIRIICPLRPFSWRLFQFSQRLAQLTCNPFLLIQVSILNDMY